MDQDIELSVVPMENRLSDENRNISKLNESLLEQTEMSEASGLSVIIMGWIIHFRKIHFTILLSLMTVGIINVFVSLAVEDAYNF